jgi:hypothetical protein
MLQGKDFGDEAITLYSPSTSENEDLCSLFKLERAELKKFRKKVIEWAVQQGLENRSWDCYKVPGLGKVIHFEGEVDIKVEGREIRLVGYAPTFDFSQKKIVEQGGIKYIKV